MPIRKRYFPFKYKLSLIMTCLVIATILSFGLLVYQQTKEFEVKQFESQRKLIQQAIVNTTRDADITSYVMEKGTESRMKEVSFKILKDFEETKDISGMDLNRYIINDRYLDVYIIDSDYVIRHATDPTDMNLDFKKVPGLLSLLQNVMEDGEFLTDRVVISEVDKSLKKYSYLPTRDKKYIIELGMDMSAYSNLVKSFDVDYQRLANDLMKASSSLDSIIRYNYRGEAYSSNSSDRIERINPRDLKYIEKAIQTDNIVEVAGNFNGADAVYRYVPYHVFDAKRSNNVDVIEIVYNVREMNANLWKYKIIILFGTLGACAAAILLGFVAAAIVSKPIEKMVNGINEIRKGNFEYRTNIETTDEFSMLSENFDSMVEYVRVLLNETSKQANELTEKNREIVAKNEEINALYEETTALNDELYGLLDQIKANYLVTVRTLSNSLEAKDKYTQGHCERVTEYSVAIGKAMGLNQDDLLNLEFAGLLHDIGKIGIPNELINKEGKLTKEEYEIVKKHPEIGYEILKDVAFLEISKRVLLQHHERVDGKGYPSGLVLDEIEILARILAVADAYDAMTSSRPYRLKAMTREQAVWELQHNRNTQFDSKVVDAFVELLNSETFDEANHDKAV